MDDHLFSGHFWQNPAVRHLAWLVTAPPLLKAPQASLFAPPATGDLSDQLLALDRRPGELHRALDQQRSRRLGVYFEALYGFALEHLWHRETVFRNLAIHGAGRTVGELDFIVRDRESNRYEHHEIAVKFYLGAPTGQWLGPDTRDRLTDKLAKLLNHQSRLSRHPKAAELLRSASVSQPDELIFLRGYLFYSAGGPSPSLPESIAPEHPRGRWLTQSQASSTAWDPQHPIIPLHKPDWLGPLQCLDRDLAGAHSAYLQALEQVADQHFPVLFARLSRQPGGFWLEKDRFFVVPDQWPGHRAGSGARSIQPSTG